MEILSSILSKLDSSAIIIIIIIIMIIIIIITIMAYGTRKFNVPFTRALQYFIS